MSVWPLLAVWTALQEPPPSPPPTTVDAPLLESLKIGGSIRARYEWREPASYSTTASDPLRPTDFVVQRTRVRLDGKVNEHIRILIEFQDSRMWGAEAPTGVSVTTDTKNVDLHQGYIELSGIAEEPLTLKVGRFEVPPLGEQRILSPLDWSNVGRTIDGVHATYAPKGWAFHFLGANVAEGEPTSPPPAGNDADDDYIIAGLYVQNRQNPSLELDLYLLHRNLSDDDFLSEVDAGTGDRKDFTFGARASYKGERWTLAAEGIYQWGRQHTDDVRAWAGAIRAEIDVADDPALRITLEISAASGNGSTSDGTVGTFDPLFPLSHFFYGHMDLIGWRNVRTFMFGNRLMLGPAWSLHLDAHKFYLMDHTDSWYDATGTALRTATATCHCVGNEIDLYVKGTVWERAALWIGYSKFLPDEYVEDTGFDVSGDWAFIQIEVKF